MLKQFVIPVLSVAALAAMPLSARTAKQTDADFLKTVAEADMVTAHLGQMAEDRLTTTDEKDFAKKLAADRSSDYTRVCDLGAKAGDKIPNAIENKADLREIRILDKEKGKAFDRAFLIRETAQNEKLLKAYKEEAEHGDNPEIKGYATNTLPVIESNLHESRDLSIAKSHKT